MSLFGGALVTSHVAFPQSGRRNLIDSNDKILDKSNSLHMQGLHVAAAGMPRVILLHTISIAPRCLLSCSPDLSANG
jgi:hypothetical protein